MPQPVTKKWVLLFMTVVLLVPGMVLAQGFQTGTLLAVAKDQSGGALPGVTVTVTSEERGTQRTGVTDGTGTARFAVLPIGFYRVEAALSGFQTVTRKGNKVDSDKTTEIPVTMSLAAASETITVTGQQPVVDRTNVAANTQVSTKEYEKAPIGRSYQTLMTLAPGVMDQPGNGSGGNPQVHGAQNTGNVYLFDGLDATDTTTGTFGSNLNFEAIQEISVQTSGMSAEYGRATGALLNVITKSGTNKFEGSAKSIQTNDAWNAQNTTKNQVTGASLARARARHNNYRYDVTLGGPLWKDRFWFFGAYEKVDTVTAAATTTVSGENYVQHQALRLSNYRATAQITPTQTIWAKYDADPFGGIVRDYWGASPELFSLTAQTQGGVRRAAQYSGIFGQSFTLEALYGKNKSKIVVAPYLLSPLNNGAPHLNQADGHYYNGATFDGFVDRPREQAIAAGSYFATLGGNSHNFKAGVDYQKLKSSNFFRYPNDQLFIDNSFDYKTRTFDPLYRLDFVDAPSTSEGKITSLYGRDKFDIGRRLFLEVGLRYEKETSNNDVGQKVLDTAAVAPRLSASYDLLGNGNTLLIGSAGRFYQSVILNFADQFANVPQQASYDLFIWDPAKKAYVFDSSVRAGGSNNKPNLDLNATYLDEITAGAQQQLGPTVGVGVRGIYRKWHDLIDDIATFNSSNTYIQQYINDPQAKRTYKGVELTFEKRFSHNWNLLANYTYSQTRGNHFGTIATQIDDYPNQTCVTTTDRSIGTNGSIPCSQVNSASRLSGKPTWDIPHVFNLLGAYAFHLGPVALTAGSKGLYQSGNTFSKTRSLTVLNNAGAGSGKTTTYYYEGVGSDRGPNWWQIDGSLEATYRIFGVEIGAKGEVFNVFNKETEFVVSNTAYCAQTTGTVSAACTTARNNYGTYTARGSYMTPRNFRLTALLRF
ncbi:MAG: TonB-dependent receptor [Thermoanaerobaculia bacterium]